MIWAGKDSLISITLGNAYRFDAFNILCLYSYMTSYDCKFERSNEEQLHFPFRPGSVTVGTTVSKSFGRRCGTPCGANMDILYILIIDTYEHSLAFSRFSSNLC